MFSSVLRRHLDLLTPRIHAARRDHLIAHLRATLLALALAVDEHRRAHAGEESLADTALWARLHIHQWPMAEDNEPCTLAEAAAAEHALRRPARLNPDGFIEFDGYRVLGTTVDVADLILEVTDHAAPSIERAVLVELWKQRTPDLMDTIAARITAKRQVGHYATRLLRKSLLFLDALGTIDRTDEVGRLITVTDRARLAELRRKWNDKYFGAYELNRQ